MRLLCCLSSTKMSWNCWNIGCYSIHHADSPWIHFSTNLQIRNGFKVHYTINFSFNQLLNHKNYRLSDGNDVKTNRANKCCFQFCRDNWTQVWLSSKKFKIQCKNISIIWWCFCHETYWLTDFFCPLTCASERKTNDLPAMLQAAHCLWVIFTKTRRE